MCHYAASSYYLRQLGFSSYSAVITFRLAVSLRKAFPGWSRNKAVYQEKEGENANVNFTPQMVIELTAMLETGWSIHFINSLVPRLPHDNSWKNAGQRFQHTTQNAQNHHYGGILLPDWSEQADSHDPCTWGRILKIRMTSIPPLTDLRQDLLLFGSLGPCWMILGDKLSLFTWVFKLGMFWW